jgi:hypothetical protein
MKETMSVSCPVMSLRPSGGVSPICSKPAPLEPAGVLITMLGAPRMGLPLMIASGLNSQAIANSTAALVLFPQFALVTETFRSGFLTSVKVICLITG